MYLVGVWCRKVLLYFISHVFGRCGVQKGFTVFYLSCIWQVWGAGRFYCILSLMYLAGVGAQQLQIKPKADAEVLSPRVVTFTSGASNGTKVTLTA